MQLYRVMDIEGGLIMIAPMATIVRSFRLFRDAEARIIRETEHDQTCRLCFNGRRHDASGGADEIYVTTHA